MKPNRNIFTILEPDRRYTKERATNRNQTKISKSYNNGFKRKENKSKYKYLISLKRNSNNETQISDHRDSDYKKILK